MTIRPAQRRAAIAGLVLAVAVAVGLVACAAPGTPSGTGAGTTTTTVRPSTSTTLAGGPGGSSTTVAPGGSTTTTVAVGGSSTTVAPGGSTTTAPATTVPVTTTTVPTTTTTWPTADVTVSPSAASVATNPGYGFVKVYWNNQKPNQLVYVDICSIPTTSPGFSVALNCAPLSELNINGTPTGKGVADLLVFRGAEPLGDLRWGCFAPGDTAPAGIFKLTTCYVRVTTGQLANNADAREAAFTIN